jgi:hypothetical protein|tara:strand:+ start:624 stop:785 length:162 start_codon:yes stop_codon:yes gene_type:complete
MLYTIFSQLFNYDFSLPLARIASKPFDYEIGIEMVSYNYYDNNKKYYGTYEIV